MGSSLDHDDLPDFNSPDLHLSHLSHPTPDEGVKTWTNTSASWKDSLTIPFYLKGSLFLTTLPLAKDNGMSTWILINKHLTPDERPILCSSETLRKRSLISDANGNVHDTIVHGIANVFCPPAYRRRGYAARVMKELAKALHSWPSEQIRCVGSTLYSDIGKTYYADLGWHLNSTNSHVVFRPSKIPKPLLAKESSVVDLVNLCERDEVMIRKAMAIPTVGFKTRDESAGKLRSDGEKRLHAAKHSEQMVYLKAVLQAAQAEAAEWKLDHVRLWDLTPLVQDMITQSGIEHLMVKQEEDSTASGLWYDENGEVGAVPLRINNEHNAWC